MKKFEMPEVEILKFDVKDVIVTSGEGDLNGDGQDGPTQQRNSVWE